MNGKRNGFTLVELIVVIMIVGVLSGSVMLLAGNTDDRDEATRTVSNLRQLKSAALMYYADNHMHTGDTTLPAGNLINRLTPYMTRTLDGSYWFTAISDDWYVYREIADDSSVKTRLDRVALNDKELADVASGIGLFVLEGWREEEPAETGEMEGPVNWRKGFVYNVGSFVRHEGRHFVLVYPLDAAKAKVDPSDASFLPPTHTYSPTPATEWWVEWDLDNPNQCIPWENYKTPKRPGHLVLFTDPDSGNASVYVSWTSGGITPPSNLNEAKYSQGWYRVSNFWYKNTRSHGGSQLWYEKNDGSLVLLQARNDGDGHRPETDDDSSKWLLMSNKWWRFTPYIAGDEVFLDDGRRFKAKEWSYNGKPPSSQWEEL